MNDMKKKLRFKVSDEVFLRQRCWNGDWLGREGVIVGYSRQPNHYLVRWNGLKTSYRYPSWSLSFSRPKEELAKKKIENDPLSILIR